MRVVALLMLLSACAAADPVDPTDEPIVEPEPNPDPVHPCDAAAEAAFDAGDAWTVQEKNACFDGCDAGETNGFDQGRLACITGGEPCPDCAPDQAQPTYDVGYKACYAEAYADGYQDEGCDPF